MGHGGEGAREWVDHGYITEVVGSKIRRGRGSPPRTSLKRSGRVVDSKATTLSCVLDGGSMELFAAIGGLSFILASLVIGLRLLLLARRTRELPEFAMGLALFLMGGLGYPLLSVARLATGMHDAVRLGFFVVSVLFNMSGMVAVCVFNWRVFRPRERWAPWLTAGLTCALTAALVLQSIVPGLRVAAFYNEGAGLHVFMALQGVPLAWAAFESLRYYRLLAKRCELGLADPIVTDRMRLWGCGISLALVINVFSSVLSFFGVDIAVSPAGSLVIAPLGLMAAGCVWLAFLPPAAYTRRVAARAAAGRV